MGGHRAARAKERYPWARYRWLDSLLGLPSRRQRLFLAHRLATSPLCNALGGGVFLGTPFYVKTWQRHGVLLLLVTTAVSVGVTFVVMWGYVLLWRLLVLAMAGELSSSGAALHSVALLSRLLAPLIISVVRKAVVTVSFGLSPKELSFASVFVDECLHLDEWSPSHHVQHWNVQVRSHHMQVRSHHMQVRSHHMQVRSHHMQVRSHHMQVRSHHMQVRSHHMQVRSHHMQVRSHHMQKLLALAKTRSLRGEVMAGYEDDTRDMGKAVLREGLLEERVPQGGVTGKEIADEGSSGEGKAEERKEQEEVGEREVRVTRQGEGDGRVGVEGAGSAGIDAIQTSVSSPQQGSCMHTAERTGLSGTHLGLGEAVEPFRAAQQQMVAAAGEKGGKGRAPGSVRPSLSLMQQALRQGGERGEGDEEMGEEGGESKEGRAGGGGSAAEGVGRVARKGGVGEAFVEGAREEMKGKLVRPRHEGQLKATGVQHGSGRQQRVRARGSREEAARVAYEFLWNDGALEAAASECETYKLLRSQLQAITHNPRLSDQECVRQVKQLCVMIEERFSELTGQFDLNHGAYFRDPRIIRAMVHFLGHRELPDWSREIDTDVLRAEQRIRFGRLGHRGAGG
ncbi:unnamed protein product [Closterium sp. NIES-65]|nr:unnamed protein product [Closterium sp. NIES-65]